MKPLSRHVVFMLLAAGTLFFAAGCTTNEAVPANVYVTAYHGYGYGPGWGYSWHPVHPGPPPERPSIGPPSTVDLPPVPWESDEE